MLLDILFPKRCISCHKIGTYLCSACQKRIKPNETLFCLVCGRVSVNGTTHPGCRTRYAIDGYSAAKTFCSPVKELIHELKYHGVYDSAKLCAAVLSAAVPEAVLTKKPLIVAIPLHPTRERERGFNQSFLLAKLLSEKFELRLAQNILKRTKYTKSQTKLNRSERQKNVRDAFACTRKLSGQMILLVDDTVTTGATISACANALKRAGASFVWAVALSQAPLMPSNELPTSGIISRL